MTLPANCTWCGHAPHSHPCHAQIWRGKKEGYVPCPCARGKK